MRWMTRRSRLLLIVVLWIAVAGGVVYHQLTGPRDYTAQLHNAAGITAGDDVRIAGIKVGSVSSVEARGAVVIVDFSVDRSLTITSGTRPEVKLGSLLGDRYLALHLGSGPALAAGGTLALANADDSYTLEQFWLDSSPVIGELDLRSISRAVDVLTRDATTPSSTQAAIDGLSQVANLVNTRAAQVSRLLSLTRAVTGQVLAQKGQLTDLLTQANKVFTLVAQRRQAVATLLADGRSLVGNLTAMGRSTTTPMRSALAKLHTILAVLTTREAELTRTLQLADPAMRLYVNSTGDGPWIGVNAPGFVMPDNYWCVVLKGIGCK